MIVVPGRVAVLHLRSELAGNLATSKHTTVRELYGIPDSLLSRSSLLHKELSANHLFDVEFHIMTECSYDQHETTILSKQCLDELYSIDVTPLKPIALIWPCPSV